MADENLRKLEREAIAQGDLTLNETLKRAQRRAGMAPTGITTITDRGDAYVINYLVHEGKFRTVAYSKSKIPATESAPPNQLIAQTKGGLIERALGLFGKRARWELPDTKLIYSTIVALNAYLGSSETTASSQLRTHLANNLLGWSLFVTSTWIQYERGPEDTLIHHYGGNAPERIRLRIKNNETIALHQRGELSQALLLALIGETDARKAQTELATFAGTNLLPSINLSTANEQYAPSIEPIILTFNRKRSHGEIAFQMNAAPIFSEDRRMQREGRTIPIQYIS